MMKNYQKLQTKIYNFNSTLLLPSILSLTFYLHLFFYHPINSRLHTNRQIPTAPHIPINPNPAIFYLCSHYITS